MNINNHPIGGNYNDIPETKTYYPSIDEFSSPLQYIQSIRDEAMKYGIIKIKPPKEWNPSFNLSFEDFKFATKVQPIHLIEKRITGGSLSSYPLSDLRARFLQNLRVFLDDMNIDDVVLNKKKVHLYDLYTKVTVYGGYYKINNDKIWDNVATELGVEWVGNTNISSSHLVKLCYELYLLDFEQTHNFPGIIKDNTHGFGEPLTPKQKYKSIIINKPEQVRKIQRCNTVNLSEINQFQTCSVCGNFPSNYDVANVILECIQCGNRWHSKCHEPQIPLHKLQFLLNGANGQLNWSCTNCTIQRTAKFGYHSTGKVYSLQEYRQKADLFKNNYLNSINCTDLTSTQWENAFWNIVDNGCEPMCIEYGSEIPSRPEKTGFPMEDLEDGVINHATHEFNLMNIKNAKGNILKHLDRDISGMTYPWIYVGMMFTAFGWHYEDHYSYSVNYNHYGGVKQWYGVPFTHADALEKACKEELGHFEQFDLVTLVSPLILHKKYKIPIFKASQHPGEFVVTFPQAYHGGFNAGFNVAEAVNFATSDWLSFGLKCAERYRVFGRRQAFAHNELICNLCERIEILDLQTLKWLFESFLFIYKSHYEFVKTMLSANVTRGRPWAYDPNQWVNIKKQNEKDSLLLFDNLDNLEQLGYLELQKDGTGRMRYEDNELDSDNEDEEEGGEKKKRRQKHEDAECVKCNDCVYVGCVRCKCDPSVVCCHKHFNEFCQCPIANKWFEFRFNLTWFEQILNQLTMKVAAEYGGSNIDYTIKINQNELLTDYSSKNYQILTQSTDKYILNTSTQLTALMVRKEFEDRYGKILGDYSNQLVRKLGERFPRLSSRKMSQDELNHLRHACECVVWGHFNNMEANNNLIEVRRYFEILCDYNAVSKILFDAWRCYSDVQKFYTQLQALQGQQDKIQVLLQNQPRFPKKLSLQKIQTSLQRALDGEIKVDMTQITSSMPNILNFMAQQEQILQNALNGILSTTWECKFTLNIQARTIVNFIPGNFSHSYWTYLQNNMPKIFQNTCNPHQQHPRAPATLEDKNTCLVLPILRWLLGEFERGILASIDCDSMNALKKVLYKGKKLIVLMVKYHKNKNNGVWLTQAQLENIIRSCTNLHLRLPYWDDILERHKEYTQWKNKTEVILGNTNNNNNGAQTEKCTFEDMVLLVNQYREYRIYSKNGDILKSYLSPIKKWINAAKAKLMVLNDIDQEESHQLLLLFEKYTHIITDPPQEYQQLMDSLGISQWIQTVFDELNGLFIISDMDKINELIRVGSTFKLKQTSQYVHALQIRLNQLTEIMTECDDMLRCIQNEDKRFGLEEYQTLIQNANALKIDLKSNDKLIQIQANIDKIEQWQQYLKDTIAKLPSKSPHHEIKNNNKKRSLSEFQNHSDEDEQRQYLDGAYKRRRKNYDIPILSWLKATKQAEDGEDLCDASADYNAKRAERQNEHDIIAELEEIVQKSACVPVISDLENDAKNGLISITQCVAQCNELIDQVDGDKEVLMHMTEAAILETKHSAQSTLNNTMIEFEVSSLLWRWHAIRYLADVQHSIQQKKEEKMKEMEDKAQEEAKKKEEETQKIENPKEEMDADDDEHKEEEQQQKDVEMKDVAPDAVEPQPTKDEEMDGNAQQKDNPKEEMDADAEDVNTQEKEETQATEEKDTNIEHKDEEPVTIDNEATIDPKDNNQPMEMEKEKDSESISQSDTVQPPQEPNEEAEDPATVEQSDANIVNQEAEPMEEDIESKQNENVNNEPNTEPKEVSSKEDAQIEPQDLQTQSNEENQDIEPPVDEPNPQHQANEASVIQPMQEEDAQTDEAKETHMEQDGDIVMMVDMDKHWSIRRLFHEGTKLALNKDDIEEWEKIQSTYSALHSFETVATALLVDGEVDCALLLSVNQDMANVIDIVKHCMQHISYIYTEHLECLNRTIEQMNAICARVDSFLNFYALHFVVGVLSHASLETMLSELDLLAQCIAKESIPHYDVINATAVYMREVVVELNALYGSRPHPDKCELVDWINFQYMQFTIMYHNRGFIQMDKYRSNNINNCYCLCRFSYTQQMRENDEEIPEMIGCDECAEWYHAECIMLDEKQMKRFLNTKKQKFVCPRCCYYEYNDDYKYFASLHWNSDLVALSDLSDLIENVPHGVVLCHCDIVNAVKRLVSWCKIWQNDVNTFLDSICSSHHILSDFNDEEIFIVEYLLNCGQISGIFTSELLILKILMRFIGKSTIWNNHEGVRQLTLHELPIDVIESELIPKYKEKSKLLTDFMISICEDIANSKALLYDIYIDLYLIKAIGVHYTTHMRRKKKGPLRVKLINQQLEHMMQLELKECDALAQNKLSLEQEGDEYVHAQFEDDNRWLKYVNDSISMKKNDKAHFQQKWVARLNLYKDNLLNKYKNSRLQIQSVVLTLDLLHKLMDG
eukprot:29742_1